MLFTILGRSGFGKTTYIKNKANELAKQGKKCIVIVPEQFTFEMERDIYLTANGNPVNVEVFSFTRLCKKVFERYGGVAGEYIDDSAKIILMNRAIEEMYDNLDVYSKSAARVDFVDKALEIVEEFKSAGVTCDALEDTLSMAEDKSLKSKLSDIAKIYTSYQALVEVSYLDPSDSLRRCLKLLEENDYFKNTCVFIDSFAIFSGVQHKIIKNIARSSEQLYITFTADSINDAESGMGVFSPVKEGIQRIITDARSVGVDVSVPVILNENHRAEHISLSILEECLAFDDYSVKAEDCKGLKLYEAQTPFIEVEDLAVMIRKTVEEENLRYKDIAVLARSLDRYESAIMDIFPKYDIPYFMDKREEISSISIIAFMLAIMDILRGGYKTEGVLSIAKSPCLNLDINSVGELENYCYIWSINKEHWLSQFENKVSGLRYGVGKEDEKKLAEINDLREKIITPIKDLNERLSSPDGKTFADAVYKFMEDMCIADSLKSYYAGDNEDMQYCLQMNSRGYSMIIDVLDNIAMLLKDKVLPKAKIIDIFKLCLTSLDMGVIPKTLDGVTIGTSDRTRLNNPKVVFVIGANFGLFPSNATENGIFSDREREKLRSMGLEVTAPSDKRSVNELYYIYSALTASSQGLCISYCTSLPDGSACSPSPIIENIELVFENGVYLKKIPLEEKIQNTKTLFRTAFRMDNKKDKSFGVVGKCLENFQMKSHYLRVKQFGEKRTYRIEDKNVAATLFGGAYTVSPSGIESYFKCPFAYFCNYGLKLKKPNKVEFSPMESGTIIHYVLEKILKKYKGQGLSAVDEDVLSKEIHQCIEKFAKDYIGSDKLLTKRFIYLLKRVEGIILRVVLNIRQEFALSKFSTEDFEFRIKEGEDTPPLCITIDEDNSIYVEGVVDRVDVWQSPSGELYIRVVDYKSGQKVFKLTDVYNGLNLQMLIYLFALCKKYKDREDSLPAGVLYMPTKDSVVKTDRNSTDDYVEKERQKQFKMNGIVVNDLNCLDAMEAGIAGKHIPAKVKKDNTLDSRSNAVGNTQFRLLEDYICHKIRFMGKGLTEGRIEALPLKTGNRLPCEYCNYRSVCKIEEDSDVKDYIETNKNDVLKLMEEECSE